MTRCVCEACKNLRRQVVSWMRAAADGMELGNVTLHDATIVDAGQKRVRVVTLVVEYNFDCDDVFPKKAGISQDFCVLGKPN